MAMRAMATKMGEAVQSFWDVLEAAYYGRFSLHEDGASPMSQLLKVGTALTIAMSASVLTSAIALPLVIPVIICWCLVAPCTGRPARRIQSFFETCAAGSLIPFVCLWCTSVALFRVAKLLSRSAPKSVFRSWASVNRKIEKTFHRTYPSSEGVILPIYRPHRPVPVGSTPANSSEIVLANEATKNRPAILVRCGIRRPRTFRFLDLPPELRNAVYRQALDPYKMLVCVPTRLLRANAQFNNAMSLLRTCRQIRHEASTYFYNSTVFHVFTRYPFYRNIDPVITSKMRELHLVTFSNSRGFNGLARILYWDLRRMPLLRYLTITCRDADLIKDGELIQNSLKTMKETYCRQLGRAVIVVLIPKRATAGQVNATREQLRSRLAYAQPAWGPRSHLSATLDTRVKSSKYTAYVAELTAHGCKRGPLRSEIRSNRFTTG
jgi:hypothetical protein